MDYRKIFKEYIPRAKDNTCALVLDIDDTLLKADPNIIGIWKLKNGIETRLSTAEFATDPDKKNGTAEYSYREFNDPDKVYNSIVNGTPILRNLKLMDQHANANWDIIFLTARSCEDVIYDALSDFLKVKSPDGSFAAIGEKLVRKYCAAINDNAHVYEGVGDPEKKANVLRKICAHYEKVKFVDDDLNNVARCRDLGLPNLQVIVAGKDDLKESTINRFKRIYLNNRE